jgi:hypothetical protein
MPPIGMLLGKVDFSKLVIELQQSEALAVLAKKGLALQALIVKTYAVREIELLEREDVGVIKLRNV